MNDQDEMFEAATETPIGEVKVEGEGEQRNVPLAHFPSGADGVEPGEKKHTMSFGMFRVTRAAIPGHTILTFRRKQVVDEKSKSVVDGRIIVADIYKVECGEGQSAVHYVVKSYMDGDTRTIFSGDAFVCRSRVEKMIHGMVKKLIKETHRRREVYKRRAAERREESAAKQEVK